MAAHAAFDASRPHVEGYGAGGDPETSTSSSNVPGPRPGEAQALATQGLRLPLLVRAKVVAWPRYARASEWARARYLPLDEVLTRTFPTDAHTAQYSVPHVRRRLDAEAPARLPGGVQMVVRIFDIDDPVAHATNARARRCAPPLPGVGASAEWWEGERPKIAALRGAHPGVFVWESRGGYKVLEVLTAPLVVRDDEDAERWRRGYHARCAYLLRRFAIECDPACADWQRLFRVPRATRSERPEDRPVHGDARSVGPVAYAPTEEEAEADLATVRALAEATAPTLPKGRTNWWAVVAASLALPLSGDDARQTRATRKAANQALRAAQLVSPRRVTDDELESVTARVGARIAERPSGTSERHNLFNAIAGALCERGVSAGAVVAVVRQLATAAGEDAGGRESEALSTVRTWSRGGAVTGSGWLKRHAPDVGAALDETLWDVSAGHRVRAALDARELPPAVPCEEGRGRIRAAVRGHAAAGAGVLSLQVTEGSGKTRETVAEVGRLAMVGTRVAIMAPDHQVANAIDGQLRAGPVGADVAYLRGVLSVPGDYEGHACRLHAVGAALAKAGHAVVPTLCEGIDMAPRRRLPQLAPKPHREGASPCVHRDTCDAFAEVNRPLPAGARVVVTVHALAGRALAWLREGAPNTPRLLVIDEAPSVLDGFELSAVALDRAAEASCYAPETVRWRSVVLRMLAEGLRRVVPLTVPHDRDLLVHLARIGHVALRSDAPWWAAAVAAYGEDADSVAAMMDRFALRAAFRAPTRDGAHASGPSLRREQWAPRPARAVHARLVRAGAPADLLEASAVHSAVARLVAGTLRVQPAGGTARHQERAQCFLGEGEDGTAVLLGQAVSPTIADALAWGGPTVLLDATCDEAVLRAVVDGPPDGLTFRGDLAPAVPIAHEVIRVADGAPVMRHVLAWSDATRRSSLVRRGSDVVVRWSEGVEGAVRATVAHVERHRPRCQARIGLITWRPLARVLLRAWESPEDGDPVAVALLKPWRAAGVALQVGWYGATRGRNDWHERPDGTPSPCDAIVLLGAPWPQKAAARAQAAALGVADDWTEVYRRAAEAEASQAAGRGRAPCRTEPLLLVAVMALAPGGWGADAEVYALPRGRAVALDRAAALGALAVHGSARKAAKALGVDHRTVDRLIVRELPRDGGGADGPSEKSLPSEVFGRGTRPDPNLSEGVVKLPVRSSWAPQDGAAGPSAHDGTGAGASPDSAKIDQGNQEVTSGANGGDSRAPLDPTDPTARRSRDRLAEWMQRAGLTLPLAAKVLERSERSLRRYLGGEREVPDDILDIVARSEPEAGEDATSPPLGWEATELPRPPTRCRRRPTPCRWPPRIAIVTFAFGRLHRHARRRRLRPPNRIALPRTGP